jgi:hypothetical protein
MFDTDHRRQGADLDTAPAVQKNTREMIDLLKILGQLLVMSRLSPI